MKIKEKYLKKFINILNILNIIFLEFPGNGYDQVESLLYKLYTRGLKIK